MVAEAEIRALDRAEELRLQAEDMLRDAQMRRADTIRMLATAAREAEQLLTAAVGAIERDTAAAEAGRRDADRLRAEAQELRALAESRQREAEQMRRDAADLRLHVESQVDALRQVTDRASQYVERVLAAGRFPC